MSKSSPEAKSELQVAIVTEGTGGIGLGAAIALADWGFEVLARWRHPERGDVGARPDRRIHLFAPAPCLPRRARMAAALAVLDQHIASPLKRSLLPSKLLTVLSETGLSPNRLEIEITERALMTNTARARSTLATLQECGIKVALDDFGVGYSNLCKLRELQFDKIKIDRSFVLTMLSDSGSAKIVRSVIELAKSLGLPTIAEGTESQDVMNQLTQDSGEYGQGYYFGKAMPAEQALELVKKRYVCSSLCSSRSVTSTLTKKSICPKSSAHQLNRRLTRKPVTA